MNNFDKVYKEQLSPILEDLEIKRVDVEKKVVWFRVVFAIILVPMHMMEYPDTNAVSVRTV